MCIAHKACEAGEWVETEGDATTDTKCTACHTGYFRVKAESLSGRLGTGNSKY